MKTEHVQLDSSSTGVLKSTPSLGIESPPVEEFAATAARPPQCRRVNQQRNAGMNTPSSKDTTPYHALELSRVAQLDALELSRVAQLRAAGRAEQIAKQLVHDSTHTQRPPDKLPDPWLFDSEKLLRELDRCRELILQIPTTDPHGAHFAINVAVDAIWNLRSTLQFLLQLRHEGQNEFARKAARLQSAARHDHPRRLHKVPPKPMPRSVVTRGSTTRQRIACIAQSETR
jgi:hypothetical protein